MVRLGWIFFLTDDPFLAVMKTTVDLFVKAFGQPGDFSNTAHKNRE